MITPGTTEKELCDGLGEMKMIAIMETKELKRLIKATAKFISNDDTRPMLQWIKLEFNGDKVRAIALDGFKLAIETAKCFPVEDAFVAYIKPYLPIGATELHSKISVTENKCLIDIGGRIVGYVQPSGQFVDVEEVLERFHDEAPVQKILLRKDLLTDAIKAVQQDSALNKPITLKFGNPFLPLIIESENGIKYVLPCRK